ncbi:MAG: helix-turn-helix domain-containing protein [Fimbriimonadaceae bacterium]
MNNANRLLTVREVCSWLGIGRSRFYELVRSGELPVIRLGPRGVRLRSSDLERFVEERQEFGGGDSQQ